MQKVESFEDLWIGKGLRPSTFDFRLSTRRQAFTLIEVVVAIVILAIIIFVTLDYILNASREYAMLLGQHRAGSETMGAMNRMRREVRMLQSTITANSGEWTFRNRQGNTNTFRLAGQEMLLNSNTLARSVQTFVLTYYDATNGLLTPLPLSSTNLPRVRRVALDFKVTNTWAASEVKFNFFLQEYCFK